LIALLGLTENNFAVERADLPLSTILTNRVRKSSE
jgi:hypothetical protein